MTTAEAGYRPGLGRSRRHEPGCQAGSGAEASPPVIDAITPAMTNAKIGKVAHNAKYDYIVLARYGLTVSPLTFDTMLAEFIVDPASRHLGLKNLSEQRLGEEMTHIEELIGKGKKQISMATCKKRRFKCR